MAGNNIDICTTKIFQTTKQQKNIWETKNIFHCSGDGPPDERGGEVLHQEQEGEQLRGLGGGVGQQPGEQRWDEVIRAQ